MNIVSWLRMWWKGCMFPPVQTNKFQVRRWLPYLIYSSKTWSTGRTWPGCYAICRGRFCTPDALAGRSHIWHETYSLPYTKVLGFVACRVTSKRLGIGSGERAWSDVKQIKDGKRSNLSGDSLEKRAILFTSAHLEVTEIMKICSVMMI